MKINQKILTLLSAVLVTAASAAAYDTEDFLRQYKDTISIVETNYMHHLPISGYERKQLFQKDFLMRAAEYGPQALLDKLLALATTPLQIIQKDDFGRTALFYAANAELADSLINRFLSLETARGLKIGYAAINEGPIAPNAKAKKFLNQQDDQGATALMVLLRDGKTSAALRLLERGADPCIQDEDGVTALHMAVLNAEDSQINGIAALQKVLKACPKNAGMRDNDGRTPADWADKNISRQAYRILHSAQQQAQQEVLASWKGKLRAL